MIKLDFYSIVGFVFVVLRFKSIIWHYIVEMMNLLEIM